MPLLATASSRFSSLLHDLIFSFPSPANITSKTGDLGDDGNNVTDLAARETSTLQSTIEEIFGTPGEERAMAGGIGPLSFVGSGYGIMLILVAILLNRIHHVVRRPRIPVQPQPHPPIHSLLWRTRIRLTRILTSPETPKYLRLPGLLCLFRAWALFSIMTLQVAGFWPVKAPGLLGGRLGGLVQGVGDWAGDMRMEKACWEVFLSVCAGLVCSALAVGLDRGRDVGAGFNLFGYSFLLHLYSSPLTHHRPPPAAIHGRPDVHALAQLWLSLTELTWLQAIEMFDRTRGQQLLPTSICGSLGLIHFVYVLFTSPLKFPSFTFLTHLLALFLSIIIIFTLVLRAFTHLFTLGYIPSPILANLLPHDGAMPHAGEDFGVAILKLGTACMWTSQYGGMRHELVPVTIRPGPYVNLAPGFSTVSGLKLAEGGFGTEITQIDVDQQENYHDNEGYRKEYRAFWKAFSVVLLNFSASMFLALPGGKTIWSLTRRIWTNRWYYYPRGWKLWQRRNWAIEGPDQRRIREMQQTRQLLAAARAAIRTNTNTLPTAVTTATQIRGLAETPASGEGSFVPYDRFLRGEGHIEDDEGVEDEWQEETESVEDGQTTAYWSEDDEEEAEDRRSRRWTSMSPGLDDEAETSIRDLIPRSQSPEYSADLQPVLLAHLISSSSSPLTRRRYQALLAPSISSQVLTPGASGSSMSQIVLDRRDAGLAAGKERDEWDDDRRRCCVVCTIEPRDTILWPCRCLAVCNECRESLAARLVAKDHMCPCCRRK